jgi:hypothetical protein
MVQQFREFPLLEYDDGPLALEMAVRALTHVAGSQMAAPDRDVEYART